MTAQALPAPREIGAVAGRRHQESDTGEATEAVGAARGEAVSRRESSQAVDMQEYEAQSPEGQHPSGGRAGRRPRSGCVGRVAASAARPHVGRGGGRRSRLGRARDPDRQARGPGPPCRDRRPTKGRPARRPLSRRWPPVPRRRLRPPRARSRSPGSTSSGTWGSAPHWSPEGGLCTCGPAAPPTPQPLKQPAERPGRQRRGRSRPRAHHPRGDERPGDAPHTRPARVGLPFRRAVW